MLILVADRALIGQECSSEGVRGRAVPGSFVIGGFELSFRADGLQTLRHMLAAGYLDAETAMMVCFKCTRKLLR